MKCGIICVPFSLITMRWKCDGLGDGIVNRDFEACGVHPGPGTFHALSVYEAGEVGHHRLYDEQRHWRSGAERRFGSSAPALPGSSG